MLGALMFASKKIMEAIPNVHLLGMFIMATTVVFRAKALFPLYLYVMLDGLFMGFAPYWAPYLYLWAILWGITMLLPKKMPKKVAAVVYPAVCAVYGFSFGALYAPAQALMMGFSFKQTLTWIVAGFGFDTLQFIGNLFAGMLVLPLVELLRMLMKNRGRQ